MNKTNLTNNCSWEIPFKDTVEGRPSDFQLSIENGRFMWDAEHPITEKTGPQPQLIMELLRSGAPIPQSIRNWIADLLDPNADTNFYYKEFKRRKSGRRPKWGLWNIGLALFIEKCIEDGDGYESAIAAATEKYGIKKTAAKKSYSLLKKARSQK